MDRVSRRARSPSKTFFNEGGGRRETGVEPPGRSRRTAGGRAAAKRLDGAGALAVIHRRGFRRGRRYRCEAGVFVEGGDGNRSCRGSSGARER